MEKYYDRKKIYITCPQISVWSLITYTYLATYIIAIKTIYDYLPDKNNNLEIKGYFTIERCVQGGW